MTNIMLQGAKTFLLYVPDAYMRHFTFPCWFLNCCVQGAAWVGEGRDIPLSLPPPPPVRSEFTLSRWGRGGGIYIKLPMYLFFIWRLDLESSHWTRPMSTFLDPNGTCFARCHFRAQKSLDFQDTPLPIVLVMDLPTSKLLCRYNRYINSYTTLLLTSFFREDEGTSPSCNLVFTSVSQNLWLSLLHNKTCERSG